jgi:hypothetical protein
MLLGCLGGSGSTDGGSANDPAYRDGVFVSDESTTGSMSLDLSRSHLAVGDTTDFQVAVRAANGQPVANMNVVCDSEDGLALIEPTSGRALTNGNGVMSGQVGCERPGSFQMVCRLTVGANRRKFAGVRCSGSGFVDFPDSGGGGLGGGVAEGADGAVQITTASLVDESGSESTSNQVDVSMTTDCDGDATTSDVEPFTDTYAKVNLTNNFSEQVVFKRLSFSVNNLDGAGNGFESSGAGVTGVAAASGGTVEILAPIFRAYGTGKYAGNPTGNGVQIGSVGFRNVTINVFGTTVSGKEVQVSSQLSAVFGNYNRCTD